MNKPKQGYIIKTYNEGTPKQGGPKISLPMSRGRRPRVLEGLQQLDLLCDALLGTLVHVLRPRGGLFVCLCVLCDMLLLFGCFWLVVCLLCVIAVFVVFVLRPLGGFVALLA